MFADSMSVSQLKAFLSKVNIPSGCWIWNGAKGVKRYGMLRTGKTRMQATRFAYQFFVGPIPQGYELDHLCRNRGCVNPTHLEPVTHLENVRRSTMFLRNGHKNSRLHRKATQE